PIWPRAARGASPSTLTPPALSGSNPRTTSRKVDLPAPLGPSTATNSPRATEKSTPDHTAAPPRDAAAPERAIASLTSSPRSSAAAAGRSKRLVDPFELAHHPRLETGPFRGQRLGHRGDRDRVRFRRFVQPLHIRRRVLGVVDPERDR